MSAYGAENLGQKPPGSGHSGAGPVLRAKIPGRAGATEAAASGATAMAQETRSANWHPLPSWMAGGQEQGGQNANGICV